MTVAAGDAVTPSQPLVVIESMKMEHVVAAETAGIVVEVWATVGETVVQGARLIHLDPTGHAHDDVAAVDAVDLDTERADLAEVVARHAVGRDEQRPDAVARRRRAGSAPPARTSKTCATTAPSSSTARWPSPRSAGDEASKS